MPSTKKWSEMNENDIAKLKQKQCQYCYYYSRNESVSGTCDYALITGHRRPCSPLECEEKRVFTFKKRRRTRRRALKLK